MPPQKGTQIGWHFASAAGLPNRYVYVTYIDPQDATHKTVYVGLSNNYNTARWQEAGQYLDSNPNIGAGHLFVSTDAGETFTNVSGNLPNVEVSGIVRRGNQLIVGTQIGVFISSDLGGSSWAPLGDGPGASTAIQNLILQPGNSDHLFAGTYGRGVQMYDFSAIAPVCTAPTIEDDDAAIAYTPGWHLGKDAGASAGTSASTPAATARTRRASASRCPRARPARSPTTSDEARTAAARTSTSTTARRRSARSTSTAARRRTRLMSPAFGVSQPFGNLAAGTHTLKIVPSGNGAVYVDGFCLTNATKGAAAASGPGHDQRQLQHARARAVDEPSHHVADRARARSRC
jgi:hypothetical protein